MRFSIGKRTISFISLIGVLLLFAVATKTGFSDYAPEIVFLLYLSCVIAFLLSVSSGIIKTKNDAIIFWGAFFVKLGYALYSFPISEITAPGLGGDAGGFWRTALQYYAGDFSRVYTPFPYVLNFLFHIFGTNVLCCCVTNIALYMIMVLMVLKVLNDFNITGMGRFWAESIAAFLVFGMIVSNSIWRESIYFAFITGSFVSYICYIRSKQLRDLYIAVLVMIPVLLLHIGYSPIIAVYIVDYFLHERMRNKRDLVNRLVIVLAFIAFVVLGSRINGAGGVSNSYVSAGLRFINRITGNSTGESTMVEAGSRYLAGLRITSVPALILFSPLKWFYYMFSPLPTNWRGLTDIMTFLLDGCVHLLYYVLSIRCIKMLKRAASYPEAEEKKNMLRIMKTGIWAVFLCGFIFGLGTSTAGTAVRHRDVMIGIESIQIGISLYMLKIRRKRCNWT